MTEVVLVAIIAILAIVVRRKAWQWKRACDLARVHTIDPALFRRREMPCPPASVIARLTDSAPVATLDGSAVKGFQASTHRHTVTDMVQHRAQVGEFKRRSH